MSLSFTDYILRPCMLTSQYACMTQLTIPESSCAAPVQSQNKETKESEAKAQRGIIQLPDCICTKAYYAMIIHLLLLNTTLPYSQCTCGAKVKRVKSVSHNTYYKRAL